MQMFNFWKIVKQLFLIDDGLYRLINQDHQEVNLYSKDTLKMCGILNNQTIFLINIARGGCFPGYAPITLKDGTKKMISLININDKLVSYDDKLNKFTVNKVINIKVGKAKDFITIYTQYNKIVCTPNHPLFTQDGWKAYKPNFNFQELNIQDKLLDINNQYHQIISIVEEQQKEEQLIYNLTTDRPNTFVAFGFIVHNMDILNLELPNGEKTTLEISQTMIIQQIKILISKKFNIPVGNQQLYYNDILLNDYKSLLDYQVQQNSGYIDEVKLVDKNLKSQPKNLLEFIHNQVQQNSGYIKNVLEFKLVSSNYQYSMNFSNNTTIRDLKNYIYFLEEKGQVILIYKGQFLNEELNDTKISALENKSSLLILNPQSGATCLKFMKEINCQNDIKGSVLENKSSLLILNNKSVVNYQNFYTEINSLTQDVIKMKQSLQFMQQDKKDKINYFIEREIKNITQDTLNANIYKKFQLHELLAIRIYSSDLVYKELNIDIRTNQYSKWKPFLKCLINSIRKCNYYQGLGYRGVRNYQDLSQYQKGKIVQWSQVSSISKKVSVCEEFSNNQGTQFFINLTSAKDIAQLSIYPAEQEIVMLPFSQFEVEEVQVQEGQAVKVNLRELPLPRQTDVILWVDDQPQNNYQYAQQLELENQDVSVVFCKSTIDAIKVVKQYKWMIYLEGSHFRIVTDMVRDENGKLNYLAGMDLLVYLFKEINYKNDVLVFCGDIKKAEENCKALKIQGSYKISNSEAELMKFIRFK